MVVGHRNEMPLTATEVLGRRGEHKAGGMTAKDGEFTILAVKGMIAPAGYIEVGQPLGHHLYLRTAYTIALRSQRPPAQTVQQRNRTELSSLKYMIHSLRFALPLDILRHQQMLTIPDDVAEVGYPVAEDNHAGFLCQLEIDLDVAMAVDKVVDIGVILDILLGEEHKMFSVFAHISRFFVVWTL